MMLPDLTIRTALGAVDLVPFLRRDAGETGVELRAWERRPAIVALHERGWHVERIASAVGMSSGAVAAFITEHTEPERAAAERAERRRKKQELLDQRRSERVLVNGRLIHPRAPHGTTRGYSRWTCRCDPCTRANTDDCATRRPA